MTYGLSTRTVSAPIGTSGIFSPTAPAVKLVPLSVFFLNREGEGVEGDDDQAMYGLQQPQKGRERPKKALPKEPVDEPGDEDEEPKKGPQAVAKRKKKRDLKKKGPPQKPKEPEQGGPEPKGGAIESIVEGKISEPQQCKYCQNPATKAYIWADGRAYIPACEKHREMAKKRIEKTNRDKVTAVRPIPQRQTTAEQGPPPITAPVLTPIKSGATRASSGTMGTGDIARYHVPLGPPLRRVTPIGDEEEERKKRKRKRKRLQGEERERWMERLFELTK